MAGRYSDESAYEMNRQTNPPAVNKKINKAQTAIKCKNTASHGKKKHGSIET